ncbi:hypothetical protein KY285_029859 [Solanum tuberosum]|nr:hypothetical protein KY285_029859 [Solanum tuberosum]
MMASVDPTIAPTVATASSAKLSWELLHMTYANKSHTRIFSLRDQLQNLKKDNRSVANYLQEIRSIADALKVVGSPVVDEELAVKILSGLGPEYREISAAIRARDSALSFEELFHKLTDKELFLKHQVLEKSSSTITVAVAQRTNFQPQQYKNNRRFSNQSWKSSGQRQESTDNPQSDRQSRQAVKCQLCQKIGHTADVCRSKSHNHFEAKVNFLSNHHPDANPWILDSGATHHVTTDSDNLEEYTGNEKVSMGDVAKFCSDNLTSVEFFPCSFHVKDLKLGDYWYEAGTKMDSMSGHICVIIFPPSISPPSKSLDNCGIVALVILI